MPEQNEPWTALLLKEIETVLSGGRLRRWLHWPAATKMSEAKFLFLNPDLSLQFRNPDLDKAVVERARQFLSDRDEAHLFQVRDFAPQLFDRQDDLSERLHPEPRTGYLRSWSRRGRPRPSLQALPDTKPL